MESHCPICLINGDPGGSFCLKCGTILVDGPIQEEIVFPPHLENESFALQTEAFLLINSGQLTQAIEIYEECAKRAPDHLETWLFMGSLYLKLEDYPNGVRCFEKAREVAGDSVAIDVLTNLGISYYEVKDYNKSITVMREALQRDPKSVAAFHYIGLCLYSTGNLHEARDYFLKSSEVKPDFRPPYYYLARSYLRLKASKKAIEAYKRVAKLRPKDVDLLIEFSKIFLEFEEFKPALEILEKVLKLNPNLWQAYINISVCYAGLGSYSKAIKVLEKVLKIKPGDPDILANLALFHHYEGRTNKAISIVSKALEANPNHPKLRAAYHMITSG